MRAENKSVSMDPSQNGKVKSGGYSTVTDLARFRGLSTSSPLDTDR